MPVKPTAPSRMFPATVVRWVDGDTVDVNIDMGFRVFSQQRLRLARINAPESNTQQGPAATVRANELAPVNSNVAIACHGHDQYGRWISDVTTPTGVNVSDTLLAEGLAVVYKN